MEMKDITMLVVYVVFAVGILMGISNQLMNTDQNLVRISNQTITPFQNNTPITVTPYDIVPGSVIVYGQYGVLAQATNYSVNANAGTIALINSTLQDWYNQTRTNVSYQYYPAAYVDNSMVRVIYAGILPILAIFVLIGAWYYFRIV